MISEHGGSAFGCDILYDFSANLNPLGMPENVKEKLLQNIDEWEKYPDHFCRKLTKKLSEKLNLPAEKIVCGNGAADLIYRIIRTVKPKTALIASPCFSEYEKALCGIDCNVKYFILKENENFVILDNFLNSLSEDVEMLILCSPNNPTGRIIQRNLLQKICEKCAENNTIFLCDECFLDFVENGEDFSACNFLNKTTVVLNAFTKIYAMAGLRLGYAAFGDKKLARNVENCGQFWSVSVPAQTAGIAALDNENYISETRNYVKIEREFLEKNLTEIGIKVFPSDANFLLLKSEIPLYDALLRERILIRSCENFKGLGDNFFRIAVRTHDENIALVNALWRVKNG